MQETQVQSLGWEDPLEKEMATYPSILAWRIPWTEEPEWATVHGVAKSQTRLSDFTSFHFLHRRQILHHLSSQGSPYVMTVIVILHIKKWKPRKIK